MNRKILIITLILIMFFSQNIFSDVNLFSSLYKTKIIGLWNFDIETFARTEEFLEATQGNPEVEEMMRAMLEMMVIEFTENSMSITANFLGDVQTETTDIRIISEESNRIIIENVVSESDEGGDRVIIIIIDDSHIQLIPEDPSESDASFSLFLVR
jgi:hypothetical protein